MPKLKSSSGAKKRFRFTKSGKIKRAKAKRRHILTGKPSKRMRLSKQGALVAKVDSAKIHRLLPYGGR